MERSHLYEHLLTTFPLAWKQPVATTYMNDSSLNNWVCLESVDCLYAFYHAYSYKYPLAFLTLVIDVCCNYKIVTDQAREWDAIKSSKTKDYANTIQIPFT